MADCTDLLQRWSLLLWHTYLFSNAFRRQFPACWGKGKCNKKRAYCHQFGAARNNDVKMCFHKPAFWNFDVGEKRWNSRKSIAMYTRLNQLYTQSLIPLNTTIFHFPGRVGRRQWTCIQTRDTPQQRQMRSLERNEKRQTDTRGLSKNNPWNQREKHNHGNRETTQTRQRQRKATTNATPAQHMVSSKKGRGKPHSRLR